jgi:hypothetical protein
MDSRDVIETAIQGIVQTVFLRIGIHGPNHPARRKPTSKGIILAQCFRGSRRQSVVSLSFYYSEAFDQSSIPPRFKRCPGKFGRHQRNMRQCARPFFADRSSFPNTAWSGRKCVTSFFNRLILQRPIDLWMCPPGEAVMRLPVIQPKEVLLTDVEADCMLAALAETRLSA